MLEKQFKITLQNRKTLCYILKRIPKEKLSEIPVGFRNNLWWNMAHIVASQQILLYRFSGLTTRVEEQWVDTYKKGTAPTTEPVQRDIDHLLKNLYDTAVWAQEDYDNGLFSEYQEYTTSTKVTLSTVEDAINFNNFHEGIHLGVILSQLKLLEISIF